MLDVDRIGSHSDAYVKYSSLNRKTYMTMGEAESLSHDLAIEILSVNKPDLLVGIASGALLPTKVVAEHIGVPFQMVHVRRRSSRYKQKALNILNALHLPTSMLRIRVLSYFARRSMERYSDLEHAQDFLGFPVRGRSIALVDDAIYTGKSVRYVQDQLIKNGAEKVTTAVLCWYKGNGDSGSWFPDIHLIRQDHYYPWSYSSPHFNEYLAWLSTHGLSTSA
jgi:hypoxanthine phosphoribosyltransferase